VSKIKVGINTIIEHLEIKSIKDVADFFMFKNSIEEYTQFLHENAKEHEENHISCTHILLDKRDNFILAYMSLVNDNVALTVDEKELIGLPQIPFSTLPSMKIGKLAVDETANEKYSGIGSFMIEIAKGFAHDIGVYYGSACRFITIDADIENNPTIVDFYIKNGFVPNEKMNNKNRITISMRKDIFAE